MPGGRARRRIFVLVEFARQGAEHVKRARNHGGRDQQNRRRNRGDETELGNDSQIVHAVSFFVAVVVPKDARDGRENATPDMTSAPPYAIIFA